MPSLPNIFGLNESQLATLLAGDGIERYRAVQLFYWLYNRRITEFDAMSNLPRSLRTDMATRYMIRHPQLVAEQRSDDGTIKYLFELDDALRIETVLIPSESEDAGVPRRLTLCMSTQVGCALGCVFCATATMKLKRNLTAGEIVGQWAAVQARIPQRITNLVYMGMGEPLHNYDAVMDSVDIITHEKTCGVSSSHITVSTAGLVSGIRRMAAESRKVKLAVSLHATTDGARSSLMPINRKHDLAALTAALEEYYRSTRRRVTFEYILFAGRNDGEDDVRRLARLTRRVPSKINLIPFHPIDSATGMHVESLRPTPRADIESFAERLRAEHVTVMLRSSSGRDIDAACGQLAVRQNPTRQNTPPQSATSGSAAPGSATSGSATSGSATPGSATSGNETSGNETSGNETSGSATPGNATPGNETPGSVTSGSATPGNATPGNETPGSVTPGSVTSGSAPPHLA